ncbi:subtilisin-like protein [Hyaloscypha bicolor E]|uniref:Subtilisin-like protein n=1 Tax=Hyaloscypha bicolor E TaxID=1095630 RepID=A0A2J6SGG4_9HELO|nr:subtilisin-like protein [Hyaloscypha bicolor E]PMD49853.1 subtilisin-like protein [Hyaloscypha bicolor E]
MAPNQELLLLMSAVVPEFLKLATTFTDNSAAAIAARRPLEKEAFYTKLHVEFKSLDETLSSWDRNLDIPEPVERTLNRALDVLESRFVKPLGEQHQLRPGLIRTKHGKLRNLQRQVQAARAEGADLKVEELQEMIHLAHRRKDDRTHMVNRLTKCNQELAGLAAKAAARQPKQTFRAKPARDAAQTVSSNLPTSQIRDSATLLYNIVTQNWKCTGHNPHTATKLRLATHRGSSSDARFEMAFCCASDTATKWQESEILLVPRKKRKAAGVTSKQVKTKGVTFSLPQKELSRAQIIKAEDRWRVEGICELVDSISARPSYRLKLLVEEDNLWRLSPISAIENIQTKQPVSLGEFLNLDSRSFDRAKKRDKFILQVILANGLLHFYKGPWLLKDWNKTHICFYQAKSQDLPDLTRPYLSTQCKPLEQGSEEEDVSFRIHPYPGILALGILLLEIELGRPIEDQRPSDSPNNAEGFNVDADRTVAMEMLEECKNDSSIDFINAVDACLDDKTFIDEFGRNASFDDPAFRQQIFEFIVKPLEDALEKVFGISVEKLDALPPTVLHQNIPKPQKRQVLSHSAQISHQADDASMMQKPDTRSLVAAETSGKLGFQVCLYDDSEGKGTVSDQMSIRADKWFIDLQDRVHPLIQRARNSNHSAVCKVFPRPGRVRIAILDTGIELPGEGSWAYEDRIREQKSWVADDDCDTFLQRGDRDLDGHGTHGAALLLQVAPEADIFVARIFKDRKESRGSIMAEVIHNRIANAIKHAVKEWEVDVISMSFGFDQSVAIIDEAIRFADDKKVIMLAAASNQGGNSNIAWPARLPQVICIYATDSLGNRCDFTPTESPRSDNFAVLGQAVKSCWPPHLGEGEEVRKSGTSTATPIAAGIAAIVLDYVKLALPKLEPEFVNREAGMLSKLRSSAGMSTVFRQMAKRKRGGYDYIVPWDFLDKRKYKETTVCDIILADLKDI